MALSADRTRGNYIQVVPVLAVVENPSSAAWRPPQVAATRDFLIPAEESNMENLKVDLRKKTVYFKGTRKFWWKIKHNSSSSSENATDTRIWYTDSKKHGYLPDSETNKLKISEIRELEERQGGEPIDWTPAEHRIKTPETFDALNKLVDKAEKEQRKHEAKKLKEARPMKPPSIKRISKTKYEIDWGKNVYRQEMACDRQMNEITVWNRRKHGDDEWDRESDKGILKLLEKVIAEFKKPKLEARKSSEQIEPASRKNLNTSSKQKKPKRPEFAERNKHGGLIIHSLANSNYYTRFDIGKSRKYPGGFTFRMNRGKFFIQETLDRESLAALEKEISWILQS